MATENKDELKINVFIADEKFQICIPRDESQSDEEHIIRSSVDEINGAIRELKKDNPRTTTTRALAAVALQLAQDYEKDIRQYGDALKDKINTLHSEIIDELSIIKEEKKEN
ncbi:MAG: cell division protein ZapA [Flavobacteriales bacterium]|jgi:cell division protein ZapA (FtsZ GTPase activity inhibitor)|nr:cell division protein ZapA [Flavobacteriales bacterium]MBQ2421866.1 cell division protein ZapA [Flavobacteriales bacterium]MBQ5814712.1 cell division protein ZapA [Flavobacteriales bacterium]MBR4403051.1 cell division protein ZapA [Flavobacteriales bacterium]